MEDDFQWKTTFEGRQPSIEDMFWKIEENYTEISSVALLSPACFSNFKEEELCLKDFFHFALWEISKVE